MVQHGIDAYYVPLDEVGRRSWISGFSGSNGDVIITKDRVSFLFLFPLEYREEFELKIEEQFFFLKGIGMDGWPLFFTSITTVGLQLGVDAIWGTRDPNRNRIFIIGIIRRKCCGL